jgi:hypothetical protein
LTPVEVLIDNEAGNTKSTHLSKALSAQHQTTMKLVAIKSFTGGDTLRAQWIFASKPNFFLQICLTFQRQNPLQTKIKNPPLL